MNIERKIKECRELMKERDIINLHLKISKKN